MSKPDSPIISETSKRNQMEDPTDNIVKGSRSTDHEEEKMKMTKGRI